LSRGLGIAILFREALRDLGEASEQFASPDHRGTGLATSDVSAGLMPGDGPNQPRNVASGRSRRYRAMPDATARNTSWTTSWASSDESPHRRHHWYTSGP
jgi:hypothetical protein